MADMANLDQTIECWEQLLEHCPGQRIVPITYMNSSAAIKAFVGEHGGAVCTSSNCRNVLEWAMRDTSSGFRVQGSDGSFEFGDQSLEATLAPHSKLRHLNSSLNPHPKVLFFPDQHLGRNTAHSMGYPLDRMVVWDPREDLGANDARSIAEADFVLWKGHCSVHQLFRPEHVDQVRERLAADEA